jgi:hypothetical protein
MSERVNARTLKRVLAGRKRVMVDKWKWDHPQTITTLQQVPLPPQRLLPGRRLESAPLRFSEFVRTLDEDDGGCETEGAETANPTGHNKENNQ